MENNKNFFEKKEKEPMKETVRVAVYHRGSFLILQKDKNRNPEKKHGDPLSLEFPGGKVDGLEFGTFPTKEQQKETAIKEVEEETGIDISNLMLEKVEEFETRHLVKDKIQRTRVHLYLVRIPDNQEVKVKINQTLKEDGTPEDSHIFYKWMHSKELHNKAVFLERNPAKLDNEGSPIKERPLARRSRHGLKKLFAMVQKKSYNSISGEV